MEHGKNSRSNDNRRAAALREMAREQSLVTQLWAVVLPALQLAGGDRAEVVAGMFQSILDCSAKAIAELKLLRLDSRSGDDDDSADDKRRVRKILSGDGEGDNDKPHPHRLKRRRRLVDDSVTLETPVPDYGGHQWRKYGQKLISNAKHQRSYYKCTYMKEQGCRATKTVQQQQQQEGGADELATYAVVYYGQHTCKPGAVAGADTVAAAIFETGSTGNSSPGGADELARTYSQTSNISVTCTSVVADHHRTASIESSYDLLGMAEDLEGGQLLDVAAFSPLDLESDWATDADAHELLNYGDW